MGAAEVLLGPRPGDGAENKSLALSGAQLFPVQSKAVEPGHLQDSLLR